jgi:hypothetical protein
VDDAAIVADYLDRAAHLPAIAGCYRRHRLYGAAAVEAAERRVDPTVIEQFLGLTGGADGLATWALANSFDAASLARVRATLVEH